MATVESSNVSAHNSRILSSVFSTPVAPPRNARHFEPDVPKITAQATKQVEADTKRVCGLNDESFSLVPTHKNAFRSHFVSCPSMTVVTPPDRQAQLNIVGQMLSTDSIKRSLRLWVAKMGIVRIKQMFAVVVDKMMSDFVAWAYAGTYNEEVRDHLRYWTEHVLSVWISVFLCVTDQSGVVPAPVDVPVPGKVQVERYQNMAYSRLWALRVDELFDIVVDWDDTVAGIDDIKPLLTTPQARQYVSQKFATALQTRLLHPGASTIEILQIYISTIRAFKRLDPRGVLLSKVSGRVRQYLRERDDTIKLVVAGLLADPSTIAEKRASDQNSDVLSELAWELQQRDLNAGKNVNSMDWNNMKWQPEPIDAVPDQAKSAKHMDVIGSVISLFESKDVFVKELQVTLAERLLRNKDDYDQETSVIEHLKIRFGDAALQACEVMLKDVLDSKRLDQVIRKDQGLIQDDSNTEDTQEPEIHAKILSRLFWPSLPGSTPAYGDDSEEEQRFKPPLSILHQRNLYEQGFENLKQTRKLTWNDNLGQVEIELTFADGRTYHDEVLPYQAGVIYAFSNDNDDEDSSSTEPITKTVSDLSHELTLPTTLVRSACLLFVSKRILQPSSHIHDAFTVLEHLPPTPGTLTTALDPSTNSTTFPTHTNADLASSAAAAQAAADRAAELAAQQAAKEVEAKEKRAKMAVYQQFVMAMLTNQGAMPLPRIAMMLGMVVPGGFPFSNEELREFLAGMVRDGGVVMLGANYKKA